MAYIDETYILKKIKESDLDNLLKDDNGDETEGALTQAIAEADSIIDGYLRGKIETLPIDPVPESIKLCSYAITMYNLHERVQYADRPEWVEKTYDNAINFLKDVSAGRVQLSGTAAEESDSSIVYNVEDNEMGRDSF